MTFPELILKARRRIADLRTASGVIIESADENGIFLSSEQLIDVSLEGLSALMRSLRAFNLEKHINYDIMHRRKYVVINVGTGIVTALDEQPFKFSKLISMQEQGNPDKIYTPIPADDFLSKRYRVTEVDEGDGGMGGCYMTSFYDEDNNVPIIYALPIPLASDVNAELIRTVSFSELFVIEGANSEIDLPFYDIDDLILDFVDRQVAIVAQDDARAKLLTDFINLKLKELYDELQRGKA
jgi:hypothetical protein